MAHRPWAGYVLAAIGAFVLLAQIALYFYGILTGVKYEIYRPVSYIAMLFGFVGFYLIDRKGAEGGADIITRTVVSVIGVIRTGRRTGDVIAIVAPVTQPVTPTIRDDESAGG